MSGAKNRIGGTSRENCALLGCGRGGRYARSSCHVDEPHRARGVAAGVEAASRPHHSSALPRCEEGFCRGRSRARSGCAVSGFPKSLRTFEGRHVEAFAAIFCRRGCRYVRHAPTSCAPRPKAGIQRGKVISFHAVEAKAAKPVRRPPPPRSNLNASWQNPLKQIP